MSWQVRHEGSPRTIDNLSLDEVRAGLAEGQWEPTDEVRGPGETEWQALEGHPATAAAAADVEPPGPAHHEDETHLDFNPLIDVCLVLLVFFILTTSVAALQARLDMPEVTAEGAKGPLVKTERDVQATMITVTIKMEDGRPVTRIEGKEVSGDQIKPALRQYVRSSGKTQLLLDFDAKVPHGSVVAVQDAAKGLGVERIFLLVPDEETPPR
jgi:biopolymer transport protein ExbD